MRSNQLETATAGTLKPPDDGLTVYERQHDLLIPVAFLWFDYKQVIRTNTGARHCIAAHHGKKDARAHEQAVKRKGRFSVICCLWTKTCVIHVVATTRGKTEVKSARV